MTSTRATRSSARLRGGVPSPTSESPARRERGINKKKRKEAVNQASSSSGTTTRRDTTGDRETEKEKEDGERETQLFLIKSEPESRMQDGHEMKYSIDDLAGENEQTTHWDGVRNYEARNIMQEMRVGDRAFYYHSNTRKCRPAIVGEVRVVREAYPDHTAFDVNDPHYDVKSLQDKPKWFMVDVQLVRKFDRCVTLDDIKACDDLADMQLVKRGRISVQRVRGAEWERILEMAGASGDDGTTGN